MAERRVVTTNKARLQWSDDGTEVTKSLRPETVGWDGSFVGVATDVFDNEIRVHRLLAASPPPVPVPRLIRSSRPARSLTVEAIDGEPLGPKFPLELAPADVDGMIGLARAVETHRPPPQPWFGRLDLEARLEVHVGSGSCSADDAGTLRELARRAPGLRFAHADITARNVLRDRAGRLVLIDWEWAGLFPPSYDLAFLWFSLIDVPGGRARVEAAIAPDEWPGFLLSAALVQLLHLELWSDGNEPFAANHRAAYAEQLRRARAVAAGQPVDR